MTEVELTFTALGPVLTRVAVEHRGYLGGAYREGWARILGRFAVTIGGQ